MSWDLVLWITAELELGCEGSQDSEPNPIVLELYRTLDRLVGSDRADLEELQEVSVRLTFVESEELGNLVGDVFWERKRR